MQKQSLEPDICSLAEFIAKATTFIEQIHKTGRPLVLRQNGKDEAVLLDVVVYDALMEKLALLEDIHIAKTQMEAGQAIENEEARAQILARLKKEEV